MKKLYERLSSLTPLLQGKEVNYLPMMVGALKDQELDDEMIEVIIESYMNKIPVGDLGENMYPKSIFDEYYIHKTNFYLGQLKKKPFEDLFHELMKENHDLGTTYEFAGILRIFYAVKSEDELMLAEALAFFDLSAMKKTFDDVVIIDDETLLNNIKEQYSKKPSKKYLIGLNTLLALKELKYYFMHYEEVVSRFALLFDELPLNEDDYPSIEEIKERNITTFEDPHIIILKDLLQG